MALVLCPECKKEISSYAKSCPHCGFPMDSLSIDSLDLNKTFHVILQSTTVWSNGDTKTVNLLSSISLADSSDVYKLIKSIKEAPGIIATGLSEKNANYLKSKLESYGCNVLIEQDDGYLDGTISNENIVKYISKSENSIHCPRCASTAVTTGSRGFSILTGFIGSGKTVNRCAKCGYTWKP